MRFFAVVLLVLGTLAAPATAEASRGRPWLSNWRGWPHRRALLQAPPVPAAPKRAGARRAGFVPLAAGANFTVAAAPSGIGPLANGTKPKRTPVVTRKLFFTLFQGDRDACTTCPDYNKFPNDKATLQRQWRLFTTAEKELKFHFKNASEAAVFFGNMKVIYGGSLDRILEACARAGTPQKCSAGPKYYGRGPVLITGADNYAAMGKFLGLDLTSNPDLLLDTNSTAGWKSALAFWALAPEFSCVGAFIKGPPCPRAARNGNVAAVTRRIVPNECVPLAARTTPAWKMQSDRISAINSVRAVFGLPPLNPMTAWCGKKGT